MVSIQDRIPSLSGKKTATFRADDVRKSQEFRKDYESKLNVVLAELTFVVLTKFLRLPHVVGTEGCGLGAGQRRNAIFNR